MPARSRAHGSPGLATGSAMAHAAFSVLAAELAASLLRGRHLVLWGPRGAGKSTLLNAVLRELGNTHSALSPATGSLDDITRALERAYKETRTSGISRRAARSRLWWAADAAPGCILRDHVTRVPSAMKGCLRRLRGGVVGVILARAGSVGLSNKHLRLLLGRPVIGDLRYLADTKLAVFKTPLAQAQIAAALAMLGDRARAGKIFAAALETLHGEHDSGYSRPDYGSRLRDGAGVLALLAEANLAPGEIADNAIADAA